MQQKLCKVKFKNMIYRDKIAKNSEKDILKFNEVLKEVELENFVSNLKNKHKTIIGEDGQFISGGQKQRIGIARALVNDPKILIFDEATNALDMKLEENIFNLVKKMSRKISLIIISHNPKIKKYCNKMYKLDEGKLIKTNE